MNSASKENAQPTKGLAWIKSLGGKFVTLTVVVLALTLGASAIYNFRTERERLYQNLERRIDTLSRFTAEISPNAVLSYDYFVLDQYTRSLSGVMDVVYAVVVSREGEALTSYLDNKNPYIEPHLQHDDGSLLGLLNDVDRNPDIVVRSFPIQFEGETIAVMRLGISKYRIEVESTASLWRQLTVSSIIIALLAAMIYVVYRLNTLRPINELVRGAARVADGKLDEVVRVYSADELGRLASSFNRMMQTLKRSREEKDNALVQLQEFNKTLEGRVNERTKELAKLNRELERLALHDALTGLPNRALVLDRLKQAIAAAERTGKSFSVIMMDLDRFKEVNDTLGHNWGDTLLHHVSDRIKDCLRKRDTVGRLGGDEFALVLPDTPMEGAVVVAQKIAHELENPFSLHDRSVFISSSLGISAFPQHGRDPTTLMRCADVAMYSAKRNRDIVCTYEERLVQVVSDDLSMTGDLRDAITRGALQLFYQPKVDVAARAVRGVEALVRWQHPTRGFVPPDVFVGLAERTGLIKPLATWVLEEAMRQNVAWSSQGVDVSISVNLSMHNVQDPQFPVVLQDLMTKWGMPAQKLVLEITESTIMSHPERVLRVLREIEAMKVRLSIDDFGMGYSSLGSLKKMPVDELKIDRSFVMDMAHDSDDAAIVKSIVDMAHTLGLEVVAEGVETLEVACTLRALGCEYLQGYFFCKPKPAAELSDILGQHFDCLEAEAAAAHGGKAAARAQDTACGEPDGTEATQ
jgi:diguanylate cyclase (GGDEF)-like protein